MAMSRVHLRALIDASVPQDFVDASLKGLVKANRKARMMLKGFHDAERRDLFGHLQRGCFEDEWRKTAQQFAAVAIKIGKNKHKTASFTALKLGSLVLTASSIRHRKDMPRFADFRNSLRVGAQIDLFDEPDLSDDEDLVYGILTHCTDREHSLYHAAIVIPGPIGRGALLRIPLTERLYLAMQETPVDSAREEEIPEPELPDTMVAAEEEIPEPELPAIGSKAKKAKPANEA